MLVNPLWRPNNGGAVYPDHIAINSATVDTAPALTGLGSPATFSTALNNYTTFTDGSIAISTGVLNTVTLNPSADTANIFVAQDGLIEILSGNTKNFTGSVYGDAGSAYHYGSGTVTTFAGVVGQTQINSSGGATSATAGYFINLHKGSGAVPDSRTLYTRNILWPGNTMSVTRQYGLHVDAPINVGGTITTNYGVYIESQGTVATNNYNIYSTGTASRNYFAGYIETDSAGGFYLGTAGSTNNRFLLNAPLASDSTAEQINTPSSTTRKALVLQMRSSQTANALEIQDSGGTLMTNFTPGGSLTFAGSRTFTAADSIVKTSGTHTVNYTNAQSPSGYDFNSTLVFSQDGFLFGSGVMFWGRPTVQNSSGSTRAIGPWLGVLINPTYQANGGTFSGQAMDFAANATFNRINSGTLSFTNHYNFWGQGGTVDTGATVTSRYGFFYQDTGTINGTLTSSAAFTSNTLNGTNKTHVLLGTATIPSGSWAIYSASTSDSYFAGHIQIADKNLILGTSTGTKLGTGTTQKLGFWNATPIVQPTTAVAAATFVANTSGIANDTATFDGYTIGQVVKALRNMGILA